MALDSDTIARVVERTCRFPEARRDLLRYFQKMAEASHNCFFQIGRGLTFDGKACLIHYFEGELYLFQLSRPKARRRGIEDMTMDCVGTLPMSRREIRPFVTLGEVRFVPVPGRAGFVVKVKVLGVRCPVEVNVPFPYPYAVQMDVHGEPPQLTAWAYPSMQPQKNRTLSFDLELGRLKRKENPISGPTVVFVSLSSRPQPADPSAGRDEVETIQFSNVVGAVVEL